jgi:hypothetical protein
MLKYFITMVSALWALTSFGQYWSAVYSKGVSRNSIVYQIGIDKMKNNAIISTNNLCSNNSVCQSFQTINSNGKEENSIENKGLLNFFKFLEIRHDTMFYTTYDIIDSTGNWVWYFGMIKTNGNRIAEYKFPVINDKDGGASVYGLTLVKNNEVILWGEGLDKRMPNPNKVPFRSVFLRIGLDGTPKSDLIWYEYNEDVTRRLSDASADIDGNLIFAYEGRILFDIGIFRAIIKLNNNNTFTVVTKLPIWDEGFDLPKIAIDNDGSYYINTNYNEYLEEYKFNSNRKTFVSKVDINGNELWKRIIPPIQWYPFQTIGSYHIKMNRISTSKNNDALCCGSLVLQDSFFVKEIGKNKHFSQNVSFIARFDTNGNLKWRHFLAPQKRDGSLYQNYVYDIQEAPDGSILVGGQLERDDDIPGFIGDAWLMRLSPDGCLNPECDHISKYWHFPDTIVSTDDFSTPQLFIYPNPGNDYLHISVSEDMLLPLRYELSTVSGQRIMTGYHGTSDLLSVETNHLSSGMYIFRLMDKSGKVWQGKWVKG